MSSQPNHTGIARTISLNCRFRAQPGAYERLLRVVRVRGFQIQSMNAQDHEGSVSLNLTLVGERCVRNLMAQLEKLQEVSGVDLAERAQAPVRATA